MLVFCESMLAQTFPEQDCAGAVKLCNVDSVFVVSNPYEGNGFIDDIPNSIICLGNGENNSAWMYFEIDSPGLIQFTISHLNSVDYDFAIYKMDSNRTCNDISDTNFIPVRCNYYAYTTIGSQDTLETGLKSGYTLTTSNASGEPFLQPLQVQTGEKYYLVIDNFNTGGDGYTLDFNGTTAKFNTDMVSDTISRTIINYKTLYSQHIQLEFYPPFNCQQATFNEADYTVSGPTTITIDSVYFICYPNIGAPYIDLFYSGTFSDSAEYFFHFADDSLQVIQNNIASTCSDVYLQDDTGTYFIADIIPLTQFNFNVSNNQFYYFGLSFNYNIAIFPSSPYFLISDDANFTYDSNNKIVTFQTTGTKEVCAVSWNQLYADTICKTIEVILSTEDEKTNNHFLITPNPTNSYLKITTALKGNQEIQYQIINTLGAAITEGISNQSSFSVDVSALHKGIYFIRLQSGAAVAVKRFVKE